MFEPPLFVEWSGGWGGGENPQKMGRTKGGGNFLKKKYKICMGDGLFSF